MCRDRWIFRDIYVISFAFFLRYVNCAEIVIQKAPGYGVSAGLNLICEKQ